MPWQHKLRKRPRIKTTRRVKFLHLAFFDFVHKNTNELFCKIGDAAEDHLSNAFLKFL